MHKAAVGLQSRRRFLLQRPVVVPILVPLLSNFWKCKAGPTMRIRTPGRTINRVSDIEAISAHKPAWRNRDLPLPRILPRPRRL